MEPSLLKILLVVVVVVIVFGGGGKLSRIMGDLGAGVKAFKKGLKEKDDDTKALPASETDKDKVA